MPFNFKNITQLNIQTFFRSSFVLIILFLLFFGISLFITLLNRPRSAYTILNSLNERENLMLQDTRVHNWSEVDKNKK